MTPTACHVARRWLLALAMTLSPWMAGILAGCGPGVGGTGTGSSVGTLDAFGASAATLCGSELAPALNCASAAAAPAAMDGSPRLGWADDAVAPRLTVHIEGDHIQFDAWCAGLRFSGDWGVIAGQVARFYGRSAGTDGVDRPATLHAEVANGGLSLSLFDADGTLLLGPVRVSPITRPAGQPVCH